jgi:signal transduction histidine kinase
MKQFYRSTPFKTAAFVLAVLFGAAGAGAGMLALYMYHEGWFQPGVNGYRDTWSYEIDIVHHVAAALERYTESAGIDRHYGWPGYINLDEGETNFNYAVALKKDPERILASGGRPRDRTWSVNRDYNEFIVYYSVNDPLTVEDRIYRHQQTFGRLFPIRDGLVVSFAAAMTAFLLLFICLMCAAGRRPGVDAVVLNPLDRVPLDIYLAVAGTGAFVIAAFTIDAFEGAVGDFIQMDLFAFSVTLAAAVLSLALALLLTFAARVKAGRWWQNTVVYRILRLIGRSAAALRQLLGLILRSIPLIWKLPLVFFGIQFVNFLLVALLVNFRNGVLEGVTLLGFLWNLATLLLVCYIGMCMQRLKKAGQQLAEGNLGFKADTKWLRLDFLEHAHHLNAIGEGMARAVEQRIRGERLKTELITNVSHDIKTPLTSIINYVDLLSKEALPAPADEYVAVLERQAGRLGKLTDDLLEASKASTGNLQVNLEKTGLCELVNQAVGEYSERLEARELTPVVSLPDQEVYVLADGRHLWRVMDNLLSNVCKYSLSGTRVYVDVRQENGHVAAAFKNISRDRLNIDSDELTERFVRGDAARSAEGSGLGLNIARSLTELQRGAFALSIDGDLFKAELRFPAASSF